jgi:hypothetical protein
MKLLLRNYIFFLLSLFVIIIFLSKFDNLDKFKNSNSNIVSLQRKSAIKDLDILFIGNSYCYSGIQPVLFDKIGINTLNLGIASAGPYFYELIVDDYLSHVSRPPVSIFILVSPMMFSSQSDNFVEYPIHRYLENPVSHFTISHRYQQYSKLPKMYQKSIKRATLNILLNQSVVNDSFYIIDRGFLKNDIIVNQEIISADKKFYEKLSNEAIDLEKVRKLEQIINALEAKGIRVILFELPTYLLKNYFNQYYLKGYETVIKKIKLKNILFRIDETKFCANSYRNIDHMNTEGSIIATKLLISEIVQNDKLKNLFFKNIPLVKSNLHIN